MYYLNKSVATGRHVNLRSDVMHYLILIVAKLAKSSASYVWVKLAWGVETLALDEQLQPLDPLLLDCV